MRPPALRPSAIKLSTIMLSTLLALTLFAPYVRAQDEDDDDRPAPRAKGGSRTQDKQTDKGPTVAGRNEVLCKAFEDVADKAKVSVVAVGPGAAYGVVVNGVIVTTYDAAKGPARITVKGPGVSGEARVLGLDEAHGIGILEAPAGATGIELADAKALAIGQFVISVGTGSKPLSAGVLSARDRKVEPKDLTQGNIMMGLMSDDLNGPKRDYPKVLQHDAPMSEETLGSALVDSSGKLIGVNVGTGFRGSSYALAVDDLVAAVNVLKSGNPPQASEPAPRPKKKVAASPAAGRPYLGASLKDVEGKLMVAELADGGPAHQGGLRPQDRIVALDGKKVATLDDVAACLGEKKPGDEVSIQISRGAERVTLKVVLGEKK